MLENIAAVASDSLDKWELSVCTLLQHLSRHLHLHGANASGRRASNDGATEVEEVNALEQRIAGQLGKMAHALAAEVVAQARASAAPDVAQNVEDCVVKGQRQLDWAPMCVLPDMSHVSSTRHPADHRPLVHYMYLPIRQPD